MLARQLYGARLKGYTGIKVGYKWAVRAKQLQMWRGWNSRRGWPGTKNVHNSSLGPLETESATKLETTIHQYTPRYSLHTHTRQSDGGRCGGQYRRSGSITLKWNAKGEKPSELATIQVLRLYTLMSNLNEEPPNVCVCRDLQDGTTATVNVVQKVPLTHNCVHNLHTENTKTI